MKKFLALMFVCAGLTAMAVTPQLNNVKVMQGKPSKALVNKAAAMPQSKMMTQQQVNKQITDYKHSLPGFFRQNNLTPNDNLLLKKAPRRVTEDVLLNSNPLFSALTYSYDQAGDSLALTLPVFLGGWTCDVAAGDNAGEYKYYAYFTQIPNIVSIDLANNTAEMQAGALAGFQWKDTVSQGNNSYIYNDTTEYILLLDANSVLKGGDWANIAGTVYDDGSINFADGWCYYDIMFVETTTVNPRTGTTVDRDTIEGMITDFLVDTWFMTPNGTHTFTASNGNRSNDVYMFQYDDTTAISWNLWGLGSRGVEMTIREDGTMAFPSQVVYYEDMSAYESQWPGVGNVFYNFSKDEESGYLTDDAAVGTVDASTITWPYSYVGTLYNDGAGVVGFGAWTNNVLTWKSEYDFWMLGKTADPVISSEVTDDYVVISLTVEDGAAYVMTVDGVQVESPYQVERGTEDKTVTVMAIAQAYGKGASEVVQTEVLIPAKEDEGMRGDVNNDKVVNISDAIALINAITNSDFDSINMDNADVNFSGSVDISDAITLISYVLNGTW